MVETVHLNFHFQELMLKENSLHSGWEYIRNIMDRSDFTKNISHITVYKYKSKDKCFLFDREIDVDQTDLSEEIVSVMYQNTLTLIQFDKDFDIKDLIANYSLEGEGEVVDNYNIGVFAYPIKWDQGNNISTSELILLIHHDGDTLFILESL